MESDIVKIVYFDEGSATDYIQIKNGGSLYYENSDVDSRGAKGDANINGGVGFGARISALLFKGYAEANGTLGASFREDSVMKSVVTNTVLTDFLALVDDEQADISILENFCIRQIPGSISSMYLLTPYLSMLKSDQGIPAGDFTIAADKLEATLSKAKGYFEFLGSGAADKQVIIRFNGRAFKNNYKPANLLDMNLTLYAVPVGYRRLEDLKAERELGIGASSSSTNPDYGGAGIDENFSHGIELPMYDVVLAGVSPNGR